jgi:hypothetical protein
VGTWRALELLRRADVRAAPPHRPATPDCATEPCKRPGARLRAKTSRGGPRGFARSVCSPGDPPPRAHDAAAGPAAGLPSLPPHRIAADRRPHTAHRTTLRESPGASPTGCRQGTLRAAELSLHHRRGGAPRRQLESSSWLRLAALLNRGTSVSSAARVRGAVVYKDCPAIHITCALLSHLPLRPLSLPQPQH